MATTTNLFSFCSLLMASLFALSASLQFNDPDWYFWFPLYATACVVNLANWISNKKIIRSNAKFSLWLGVFLFLKVVIEDFVYGIAGFWSLDMRERVVREKFGSRFVVCSMFLQLEALSIPNDPTRGRKVYVAKHVQYGMAVLVGFSYGVSFLFFVFQKEK
ncbi:uncharacterized protein LOC132267574 isoform X2 [Cornus florida]|uniref:uncharacterized protein LOC132267574 isoform X2 n=1 Tax=Cornus florida TaxID=4283 RepID=UPI0028993380|nr:uncharacterized protein LOC132267574 isoform X2 [Cornus florida]